MPQVGDVEAPLDERAWPIIPFSRSLKISLRDDECFVIGFFHTKIRNPELGYERCVDYHWYALNAQATHHLAPGWADAKRKKPVDNVELYEWRGAVLYDSDGVDSESEVPGGWIGRYYWRIIPGTNILRYSIFFDSAAPPLLTPR